MLMPSSPRRRPICPAPTDARATAPPRSKTLIAVTFVASSPARRSRSRVRSVPENIRT
jgi:hypothetical protein